MLRSPAGSRHVLSAPNPSIRCWRTTRSESEQRLKGRRRCSPTIVPEHELVQINLELRSTDAMMGADEPLLKIANNAVRQRHGRWGSLSELHAYRLRARDMPEAGDRQPSELFQAVGIVSSSPR